jgi:predicted nuclease of predicted toxin-antitoxin system
MRPSPPRAFYLDHNVPLDLAALLRARGYRAVHTRELGLQQQHDAAQLLTALDQQAVLVTHDRQDYLLLHRLWQLLRVRYPAVPPHAGILRLPVAASPQLAAALATFVHSGRVAANAYHHWQPDHGWTPLA